MLYSATSIHLVNDLLNDLLVEWSEFQATFNFMY